MMNRTDYFYRAYTKYQDELKKHRDTHLFKKAVVTQKNKKDYIEMTRTKCSVNEDWVKEIEKGLVFIGKAIAEDRQFIRNEGDVMPIEKIRRVSQDSITDLAKHSNYITRLPEEEDDLLVPDKLLMINRENDYHVYENRVVFATLSYLRDFVSIRLNAISELANRYDGKVRIKREVNLGYRNIDFVMELDEVQKDDPLLSENNTHTKIIERLNGILNEILILLRTRLMNDVSKAPLVKRPITKTNVLKMNINFRESLALFDYISAYPGDGYTIETTTETINPLLEVHSDAYADIILLSSFLTYKFNYDIEEDLHKRFLAEEKRRQEIKDQELLDALKEAMERAKKSGKEINEYIYLLEEGYKVIERQIADIRAEMAELIVAHQNEITSLKEEHAAALNELETKYKTIIDEILADHAEEIKALREGYEKTINELELEHTRFIEKMQADHEITLKTTVTDYESKLQSTVSKYEGEVATLKSALNDEKEKVMNLNTEMKAQKEEFRADQESLKVANAQLFAYRTLRKNGPKASEFTKREHFLELQEQKEAIDAFFKEAWRETKKVIRSRHIPQKPKRVNKNETK